MREQPVAGGKIYDATTPERAPHPPRYFPGLVELLPRKTPGAADRTSQTIEQRPGGESTEVVLC